MIYFLSFLVVLGILIFVHEFGHFIVARRLGVGVTKFSFGFGPKLVGIRRGETEYLISAIPLGGYVKLVGENDADEVSPEEQEKAFYNKPVWVKMAVVAAGPIGNLLFAFLVFWVVFLSGVPTLTPKIGDVMPDTPAARAGSRPATLSSGWERKKSPRGRNSLPGSGHRGPARNCLLPSAAGRRSSG